ncbi:hypothetical protein NLX86_06585 [Streptomyces sp. A3M-1-3]|uniref:hypothetical protein n=1 Tax=Streptomyces sp. A3M-1-3 TaxID=2962044 RepID=UPI0020B73EF1|nr:hypothetical protein [Streptomyces sp. A3M-1-3]MCP3817813.1 hypothetical protein [Streptomyces sp. A3M-1-3]
MTETRHTVDTITSDELDALYDEREEYARGWLNIQAKYRDVRQRATAAEREAYDAGQRARRAEAAIARAREYVGRAANTPLPTGYDETDRATRDYAREILAALDTPKEPTS